jgi:hypothetical protein
MVLILMLKQLYQLGTTIIQGTPHSQVAAATGYWPILCTYNILGLLSAVIILRVLKQIKMSICSVLTFTRHAGPFSSGKGKFRSGRESEMFEDELAVS